MHLDRSPIVIMFSINLYKPSINARKTNLSTRLQWPYPSTSCNPLGLADGVADVLFGPLLDARKHISINAQWSCHVTTYGVCLSDGGHHAMSHEKLLRRWWTWMMCTWAGIDFTCDIYELAGIMLLCTALSKRLSSLTAFTCQGYRVQSSSRCNSIYNIVSKHFINRLCFVLYYSLPSPRAWKQVFSENQAPCQGLVKKHIISHAKGWVWLGWVTQTYVPTVSSNFRVLQHSVACILCKRLR